LASMKASGGDPGDNNRPQGDAVETNGAGGQ
jgi:hypothetical protein